VDRDRELAVLTQSNEIRQGLDRLPARMVTMDARTVWPNSCPSASVPFETTTLNLDSAMRAVKAAWDTSNS